MIKKCRTVKKISVILFALAMLFSLAACSFKSTFCIHDFTESTVAATCESEGVLTKTCAKCGYITKKTLPKVAHTYGDETRIVETATCQKNGKAIRVCSVCGYEDEIITPKKDHVIKSGAKTPPTCTESGYTLGVCSLCGETEKGNFTPALGHDWGNWIEITAATEAENGTLRRECKRCGKTETQTTVFYGHIDDSALTFAFNAGETPVVKSEAELQAFYKAVIFNRAETATCTINDFTITQKTINSLSYENAPFAYSARVSATSSSVTITAEYGALPSKQTAASARQTQYASANHYKAALSRAADYDGFKINSSSHAYPVTYTDQLYYVLERGYKPIPVSGSPAERVYEKIKAALREIISDDMTDFQKVRAIHDYLVMNVVYDNALYSLAFTSTDVKSYNGFYLEGVFDDKIAVCDGISKAFSAMANVEGIPCVRVTGKKTDATGNVGHAWNKVLINNAWYIADATSDNVIVNDVGELLSLEYFLVTDVKMAKTYIADDYTELKATTEYSARYTDNAFKVLAAEYDFVVDSDEELYALIKKAQSASVSGGSLQFTVGSGYKGDVEKTVEKYATLRCLTTSLGGPNVYTFIFTK